MPKNMTSAEFARRLARRGIKLTASSVRYWWTRGAPRTVASFERWHRERERLKAESLDEALARAFRDELVR